MDQRAKLAPWETLKYVKSLLVTLSTGTVSVLVLYTVDDFQRRCNTSVVVRNCDFSVIFVCNASHKFLPSGQDPHLMIIY